MLRYMRLDIELDDKEIFPQMFMGSALRGAFGMALKRVICINPSRLCDNCFNSKNCLYFDFFEEKNTTHLYRFSKGLSEDNFDFSLFLFEDACDKLPYVIKAIFEMLTRMGLGANREKFNIKRVICNDEEIYKDSVLDLHKARTTEFSPRQTGQNITLFLKTPLRIKKDNRYLTTTPALPDLIRSVHRRYCEIKSMFSTKLSYEPIYQNNRSSIVYKDVTRYSNRQKSKMQMGGVMGFIEYTDVDEKSLIYLQLGEILGIGKQTVFGLGEIAIRSSDSF